MTPLPNYVLITPARNEAQFIELTIRSVIAQTVPPIKWVIVSDGSTDGTDDIVKKHAADHAWIELVRLPERNQRDFAAKVHAFNTGYSRIKDLKYDVIVSLDGDISFDEDYFSYLLAKLADLDGVDRGQLRGLGRRADRRVRVRLKEGSNSTYDYRYACIEHVSGACQVFRRQCFEEVGGYIPVKGGCIDHIAVITARMRGWKTRTFTDKTCLHHRPMGTAQQGLLMARFKGGAKDYAVGNHPLWELFRATYQMSRKPFFLGGLMLASGYLWSMVQRLDRPVSPELVRFYRREQMQRLGRLLTRKKIRRTETLEQSRKCA